MDTASSTTATAPSTTATAPSTTATAPSTTATAPSTTATAPSTTATASSTTATASSTTATAPSTDAVPVPGPPTIRTFGPSPVRDATTSLTVTSPPPPSIMLDVQSLEAQTANYTCRHCQHNCSTGDMKKVMIRMYPNDDEPLNESRARSFGWTEETPHHFFEVIRHVENRTMSFVCPSCYIKHPFKSIDEQQFEYNYRMSGVRQ